jgi:hypothetical protein
MPAIMIIEEMVMNLMKMTIRWPTEIILKVHQEIHLIAMTIFSLMISAIHHD